MLGGTLALLTRSLRIEARLLRSHLFRFLFVGIICFFLLMAHSMSMVIGAPGLRFFQSMAYLNFFLITLAGTGFFATAITEEKEEETLGLLMMAGINRVGILLGKSTSRLLSALLLLLVQLPFILLGITLGGVTLGQVIAVYWGLFAYLAFVANLALLCSVICRRSNTAAAVTGLLLAAFLVVPSVAINVLGVPASAVEQAALAFFRWFAEASVFGRLSVIMRTAFAESAFSYQVLSNFAAAFVLFCLSWCAFRFTAIQHTPSAPSRGFLARQTGRLSFLSADRAWKNAVMWKDFYFLTGGKGMMIVKFTLYGLIVLAIGLTSLMGSQNVSLENVGGLIGGTMLAAIALESSVLASRIFHEEVKWKTLPALSMLPVSIGRIAYFKTAGCVLALIPAATYLAIGAVFHPWGYLQVIASPFLWFGVTTFVIFLHLTAVLSLVVKWGALPLSFAVMFIFNSCCPIFTLGFMLAAFFSDQGWGTPIAILTILVIGCVPIVSLQVAIHRRLRTVASR